MDLFSIHLFWSKMKNPRFVPIYTTQMWTITIITEIIPNMESLNSNYKTNQNRNCKDQKHSTTVGTMTNHHDRGIGSNGSNFKLILLCCVVGQLVTQVSCGQKLQQPALSSEENDESGQIEVLNVDGAGTGDKMGKNVEVRGVLEGLFGKTNDNSRGSHEWDNRGERGGYGGYDGRRPNDRRNNGPCIVVRNERGRDDDDRHHHHHHRHGK